MSERSSGFEQIAQEEEKGKKEEGQKMSRRNFLINAGKLIGAAAIGASALEAGCAREDKRAKKEEERMRESGKRLEDMFNKDKAEEAIKNDPLSGYDGLKHFRDLNKDVKEGSEEYKAAEKYFKTRGDK